jgi:serine/threonine-protein kinase
VLLGALAVLAALAVAVVATQAGSGTPAEGATAEETTEQPAAETTPPPIAVAAEDYLTRPVAAVQAALIGQGLQVTLVPVETADVPAGQVTAIDPVGDLPPGSTVTVSYAVPPVVVPTPAPAPAPPAQDAGEDEGEERWDGNNGNGRGNGRGKDKDDD